MDDARMGCPGRGDTENREAEEGASRIGAVNCTYGDAEAEPLRGDTRVGGLEEGSGIGSYLRFSR
jgi:hypothetical protein